MSLEWRAARSNTRSIYMAWSNPVAWWWSLLSLVSGVNIAVWFLLYRQLHQAPTGPLGSTSGIQLMLLLCAAYVFGCAFRSFLPRAVRSLPWPRSPSRRSGQSYCTNSAP